MSDRTPQDFAIEHAEYMARDAENLLDALNAHTALVLREEELNDVADSDMHAAREYLTETIGRLEGGIHGFRTRVAPAKVDKADQTAEIARLSAALAEKTAQLEAERARNAAAQSVPKVVGYLSKTGHGTYFRETITPALAELEWCGTPMWRPVAFVDSAPPLAIIPGATP